MTWTIPDETLMAMTDGQIALRCWLLASLAAVAVDTNLNPRREDQGWREKLAAFEQANAEAQRRGIDSSFWRKTGVES